MTRKDWNAENWMTNMSLVKKLLGGRQLAEAHYRYENEKRSGHISPGALAQVATAYTLTIASTVILTAMFAIPIHAIVGDLVIPVVFQNQDVSAAEEAMKQATRSRLRDMFFVNRTELPATEVRMSGSFDDYSCTGGVVSAKCLEQRKALIDYWEVQVYEEWASTRAQENPILIELWDEEYVPAIESALRDPTLTGALVHAACVEQSSFAGQREEFLSSLVELNWKEREKKMAVLACMRNGSPMVLASRDVDQGALAPSGIQ